MTEPYRFYKISTDGGTGSFLSPPGHPRHRYSLHEYVSSRGRKIIGIYAIDYALTEEANASPELRARVQRIMDEAPAPSELWIRHAYGYFRNMYVPESGSRISHNPAEIAHDRAAAVLDTLRKAVLERAETRAAAVRAGGSAPKGQNPENYRRGVTPLYGRRRGYEATATPDGTTIYVYALADDGTRYGADHLADYADALDASDDFTNVRIAGEETTPGGNYRPERVAADLVNPPAPMDPERHAAVAMIREYVPDHAPRLDLITDPGKGYGSYPCTKCGERVQYEAKFDKLTKVSTRIGGSGITQWSYQTDCPKGGDHTTED